MINDHFIRFDQRHRTMYILAPLYLKILKNFFIKELNKPWLMTSIDINSF